MKRVTLTDTFFKDIDYKVVELVNKGFGKKL